jgi:hypothetical protein
MFGRRRDNASLLHGATKDYRERPRERLSSPLWHRLVRRWTLLGFPTLLLIIDQLATATSAIFVPPPTWARIPWSILAVSWWITVAVITIGYFSYRLYIRWLYRSVHREFVVPCARAVCATFGLRFRERSAADIVAVPATWSKVGRLRSDVDPIIVKLPEGAASIEDKAQKALVRSLTRILGLQDPVARWHLTGSSPTLTLSSRLLPVDVIRFQDILSDVAMLSVTNPLVGYGYGKEKICLDFDNESPHLMVSAAAGAGKSTLIKCVLCQRMHHGNGLIVLDFKRISQRWAHNLPGALYAWNIKDIHDLAIRIGEELEYRIANVVEIEAEGKSFTTIDVMVEEANVLASKLRDYWKKNRPSDTPAGESPAVAALKALVFAGREFRMHAFYVPQRGSAAIFGNDGGDVRESFSSKILAKWSPQTWKMLAGGIPYLRWPGGKRGLWALIQSDTATFFRAPLITDAEAREWAMSGVPCPITPIGELSGCRTTDTVSGHTEVMQVTLAQALLSLPGQRIALSALRQAAHRDPRFPKPVGKIGPAFVYDLEMLKVWKLSRREVDSPDSFSVPSRKGIVYAYETRHPDTGETVVGYIGQTRRSLRERDLEHIATQPWADLIVEGSPVVLWQGACTDAELDHREQEYIAEGSPLYNFEGQETLTHRIRKPDAVAQRHARDRASNRPLWAPVTVSQVIDLHRPGNTA